MRGLLLALALVVIAGTASAQAPDPQFLIAPGVGIGPLHLGMTITEVTRILGPAKSTGTKIESVVLPILERAAIFLWDPTPEARQHYARDLDGFAVVADKTGTVLEIQSPFDIRYSTAEGLGVGSTPNAVMDRFGSPSRQPTLGRERYYVYDTRGIAFLI